MWRIRIRRHRLLCETETSSSVYYFKKFGLISAITIKILHRWTKLKFCLWFERKKDYNYRASKFPWEQVLRGFSTVRNHTVVSKFLTWLILIDQVFSFLAARNEIVTCEFVINRERNYSYVQYSLHEIFIKMKRQINASRFNHLFSLQLTKVNFFVHSVLASFKDRKI